MSHRILATQIDSEQGLVRIRDRTRQIGELCGLDDLQRTRFVTAVSEIARNCVQFAGRGSIEFWLQQATLDEPQCLIAKAIDRGPGIAGLDALLEGGQDRQGRAKLGIAGSRRLVDKFTIESDWRSGTTVTLTMRIPANVAPIRPDQLSNLLEQLLRRREQTPNDELEQQNRDMLLTLEALRERQAELQQADERKNEFLAMLAHELRNPLSAIRTALELIKRKRDASPEDVQRIGSIISRQTDQLTHLVSGLLDVARVTQGKVDLEMTRLSVNEVVAHAIEMTQSMIDTKGHRVQVSAQDHDVFIDADPVRFKQVLGNLIHNAVRYTPDGGDIAITIEQNDDLAIIRIQDNGIGIAADMLPRVFDLFTQAKTGLDRHEAGLGVGLTVVQRMVQEHGGTVHVASAGIGQGSVFTVCMPLATLVQAPVALDLPLPAASKRLRVLLIDDNVDAADMLSQMLTLLNYEVHLAHTGEGGVSAAQRWQPDVAIIDIGLPGMSGFEVAHALRNQAGTRPITLIALSGYSAASVAEHGDAKRFNHYLEKPVEVEGLARLLHTLSSRGTAAH